MGILRNAFKKSRKGKGPELKLLDTETPYAVRQAYKALYTNVLYLNIDAACKKIVVTSAVPEECKSTVSSNLSVMLAENLEDKKILLIDSDMRSPKIWSLFGTKRNEHGLSEYLAGIDESPNFQQYKNSNLFLLTSGGQSVSPTKLVGSQRMKKLLELCEEDYDYVIIDTPPVNVVSDALLLGNVINGYIISARSDSSDINSISQCVENITNTGNDIYGIVLSDVKLKGGVSGKYGKYGNRYAKYEKEIFN